MPNKADITRIKNKLTRSFQRTSGISPTRTISLLPIRSLQGKLYEASVLAEVCENLVSREGYRITLVGGPHLILKQKGGPINRLYPYFQLYKDSTLKYELFTDVYFNTLSYHFKGRPTLQTNGDYHELDIALIKPNLIDKPNFDEIALAIECKNTSIEKKIIRELLGYRRELSYVDKTPNRTSFINWPLREVYANPSSVHMLYTTDRRVLRYIDNCSRFGIVLNYLPL